MSVAYASKQLWAEKCRSGRGERAFALGSICETAVARVSLAHSRLRNPAQTDHPIRSHSDHLIRSMSITESGRKPIT